MTGAIIIIGNEKRFFDNSIKLRDYLIKYAGIESIMIEAAYLGIEQLEDKLRAAVVANKFSPLLLIFYNGHGLKEGWAVNPNKYFRYETLVKILKERIGRTLLINDCCHAFSVMFAIQEASLAPENFGVIAACGENEESYGISESVLESWSKSEIYLPRGDTMREVYVINNIDFRKKLSGVWRHEVTKVLNRFFPRLCPHVSRIVVDLIDPPGPPSTEVIHEHIPGEYRWGAQYDFFSFRIDNCVYLNIK